MVEAGATAVELDLDQPFPCSGFVTPSFEGYIVVPGVKLGVPMGKDIAIAMFSPKREAAKVSPKKTTLAVETNDAYVTAHLEGNGELRCNLTASGRGFRSARLEVLRWLKVGQPTAYPSQMIERIAQLIEPGLVNVVWKPSSRVFEEFLAVFYPYPMTLNDMVQVVGRLGADVRSSFWRGKHLPGHFLVGESTAASHMLKLVLDQPMCDDLTDETEILLS